MKICKSCGAESNTKFCPECGAELESESSSEAPQPIRSEVQAVTYYPQKQENGEKLSQKTWFVVLLLIFFFPVGLYLMWNHKKFNTVGRVIVSVVIGLFVIVTLINPDYDTNTRPVVSVDNEPSSETTTVPPTEVTTESTTVASTEKKFKSGDYKKISYDKLARTPDEYLGSNVKHSGQVIQVIDGDDETQLRIAIGGNYDKVVLVGYDPSIMKKRVLEDDNITYYGTSVGLMSYESTIGGKITIPGVFAKKIKIKN